MKKIINAINLAHIFVSIFLLVLSGISYAQDYGVPDSMIVGNLDRTSMQVNPGDTIAIPIWLKNDENIGGMLLPIAGPEQFIAQWTVCEEFGQLATWPSMWDEDGPIEDEPYIGYTTQRILGVHLDLVDPDLNGVPVNTYCFWEKIAEYTCIISSDESNIRDSTQLIQSFYPPFGSFHFSDDTGDSSWTPVYIGGYLKVVHPGYEYYPGDANMTGGVWPPYVQANDITYLVNYFRGQVNACNLDDFYAAADANGDCLVTGNDVTRLRSYFMGMATISFCPNYPTQWPTAGDIPPSAPSGWPNCE